jgi:hypothetical protein
MQGALGSNNIRLSSSRRALEMTAHVGGSLAVAGAAEARESAAVREVCE